MAENKKKPSVLAKEGLVEYGTYVIEDRALPDYRDGLKPVQRRLVWVLHDLKRDSKAVPVKCARVVGDTLGRYHPHGDQACYGALVTTAWLRYPLVQKHGNFGNKDALLETPAAQYRYTETQLSEFADRLFDDISVMPLVKSYTEEHEEPFLLPVRVPMILVNGCAGVAFGVSTRIPPHNLEEVIRATLAVLRDPECSLATLLKYIKGPDYGSGVLLSRKDDLRQLYSKGEGRLNFSCTYHYEDGQRGRKKLVVTGVNPGFNANKLLKTTQQLADSGLLETAANDESSLEVGTRIVVEFKDPKIIQDRVLPLLRSAQTYQFYALDNKKRPRLFNLKSLIKAFIRFRRKVEKLVLEEQKEIAERKLVVVMAKIAAATQLKKLIEILSDSLTDDELVPEVCSRLGVNEEQAAIILDTKVRSLRRANVFNLEMSKNDLQKKIKAFGRDLENIDGVVARRLEEMLQYADKRGTKLRGGQDQLEDNEANGTTYYVGVTPQGKVDSFPKPPTSSRAAWPYVDLVQTPGTVATVSTDNIGQSLSLSFLDKMDANVGTVLGVASERDDFMVAITDDGKYVAFPPVQRRDRFPVFKEMPEQIIFAGGMQESDMLIVVPEKGKAKRYRGSQFQVTRPNVKSRPLPFLGRTKIKVMRVFIARDDADQTFTWIDQETGKEVRSDDVMRKNKRPVFSVGKQNLVVIDGVGKRGVVNKKKAIELIRAGIEREPKVIVVIPME